jgi:hypothetical protein
VGGVAAADAVVVELGAGAAGAGVAHLPEVVLHAALEHVVLGQVAQPELAGLLVGGGAAAVEGDARGGGELLGDEEELGHGGGGGGRAAGAGVREVREAQALPGQVRGGGGGGGGGGGRGGRGEAHDGRDAAASERGGGVGDGGCGAVGRGVVRVRVGGKEDDLKCDF